jgi:outer membrane protein OmpA-like peptidoglycan-associated protein
MSKRRSERSRAADSRGNRGHARKTPGGVWVIVGLAVFFVIGGLGVSAFILVQALRGKQAAAEGNKDQVRSVGPMVSVAATPVRKAPADRPRPSASVAVDEAPPRDRRDPPEEDQMRQEVLVRIDLMRSLTNNEKDKLYVQVERAQGFEKIALIPFPENSASLAVADIDAFVKAFKEPAVQKLLSDPTVVVFVVGFADKRGDETRNMEISRDRAESVVKVLKEKTDIRNVIHAVGMGGQDLFDHSDPKKNRVVEVWAAEP